jgi:hypothetical protein
LVPAGFLTAGAVWGTAVQASDAISTLAAII